MKKKSFCLALAGIIGIAYAIYLFSHFGSAIFNPSDDAATAIGEALATALVTPHMLIVILAVIFNIIAFLANQTWAAILSGILYIVAGVIFIMYIVFVLPSAILSFIGAGKLNKLKKRAMEPKTNIAESAE